MNAERWASGAGVKRERNPSRLHALVRLGLHREPQRGTLGLVWLRLSRRDTDCASGGTWPSHPSSRTDAYLITLSAKTRTVAAG